MLDGVLVVDKPGGLTSHDVVDAARRALRMTRIGHTGTLDPMATGVLPLACGKATRLVRFLIGSRKAYRAGVRFGLTTDSYDVTGTEVTRTNTWPDRAALEHALTSLRGERLQMPPAFSAKKVGGRRAYEMARRQEHVELTAVPVTLFSAALVSYDAGCAVVDVVCSAGYYVRSFAHEMGQLTGTGACLEALRRTSSGQFTEDSALPLDVLGRDPASAERAFVPMIHLLPGFPSVVLDEADCRRVSHGQSILALGHRPDASDAGGGGWTKLLDAHGHLLAVAESSGDTGALHPVVVLI